MLEDECQESRPPATNILAPDRRGNHATLALAAILARPPARRLRAGPDRPAAAARRRRAGPDGDGDVRPGVILGIGLPVRGPSGGGANAGGLRGGQAPEPDVYRPGRPHRSGPGGLRPYSDLLPAAPRGFPGDRQP